MSSSIKHGDDDTNQDDVSTMPEQDTHSTAAWTPCPEFWQLCALKNAYTFLKASHCCQKFSLVLVLSSSIFQVLLHWESKCKYYKIILKDMCKLTKYHIIYQFVQF